MCKIGTYKILPTFKLIIEYYSGNINIDDLIHLKRVISLEQDYNPTFTSLVDFRDAILNVDEKDLIKYLNFVKEYTKVFGHRNTVFLTSTPNDVVKTTLFSLIVESFNMPISVKIYSTIEAVNCWINIEGINENSLLSFLDELKIQPDNVYSKYA